MMQCPSWVFFPSLYGMAFCLQGHTEAACDEACWAKFALLCKH